MYSGHPDWAIEREYSPLPDIRRPMSLDEMRRYERMLDQINSNGLAPESLAGGADSSAADRSGESHQPAGALGGGLSAPVPPTEAVSMSGSCTNEWARSGRNASTEP